MATQQIALHCFISGVVQGVFFRAETCNQANALGITGWVRNLPDGRVEALICGEESQVRVLENWLQQGPPQAKVTNFVFKEVPWQEFSGFTVNSDIS